MDKRIIHALHVLDQFPNSPSGEQLHSREGKPNSQSKTPYAANGRPGHTAFLTVIFTFARTSGADLTHPNSARSLLIS